MCLEVEMAESVAEKRREKQLSEEKKARKKARAKARRAGNTKKIRQLEKVIEATYKPLDQWDIEELARGRPRDSLGRFSGPVPKYINRQVHEEAISRFKEISIADMRAIVPAAIQLAETLIQDTEMDDKGRWRTPASVRLDAAKWVVEHLIGKPTQRTEMDISVKLQGVLGNVMVAPELGTGKGGLQRGVVRGDGEVGEFGETDSWDGRYLPAIDATYRELELGVGDEDSVVEDVDEDE